MIFFLFVLFVLRTVCIPIPEMMLIILGLSVYGENNTFFIALSGTIVGICINKVFYERCYKWLVNKKGYKKKLRTICSYIKRDKYKMIALFFIVPVFPDMLVCMGAATLEVKLSKFLHIAIISKAISIGSIVYANQLARICNIKQWHILVFEILVIQVVSLIIKRNRKTLNCGSRYYREEDRIDGK